MNYNVNRCVCHNTTFERWLELKKKNNWSMEEASDATQCGQGCGMCRPYLKVVAALEQTVLPAMIPEDLEEMAREAEAEKKA